MNFSMQRLWQITLVAALALLLLGAGDDARFASLGHKLMCRCGCNQVLLECNHVGCEYSERMRGELAAALQRGESDNLILDGFVQKYGTTVLAAPTTKGFNIVAWIVPFIALGVGTALAVFVVRIWKHRMPPAAAVATGVTAEELDVLRRRAREETGL